MPSTLSDSLFFRIPQSLFRDRKDCCDLLENLGEFLDLLGLRGERFPRNNLGVAGLCFFIVLLLSSSFDSSRCFIMTATTTLSRTNCVMRTNEAKYMGAMF